MPNIQVHGTVYTIRSLPNECPYCHQKIIPVPIAGHKREGLKLEIYFSCPDAGCNRSFVGYMRHISGSSTSFEWNGTTTLGVLSQIFFSDTIISISSAFVDIYNQAYQAEQYQLMEICGVGYRKALEFLMKDYVHISGKLFACSAFMLSACFALK